MKLKDKFISSKESRRFDDNFCSRYLEKSTSGGCSDLHDLEIGNYYLRLEAVVKFSSPESHYEQARKNAENLLLQNLFSEQLAMIHDLRLEIFNGDRDAALKTADRLFYSFKGE